MFRVTIVCIALALCVVLSGCITAPVVPPVGLIFGHHKAPLDTDYKDTQLGKTGMAESHCVLGLVSWGDASTDAAARQGGLSTVNHADYEFLYVVFGIYQQYTTIVYGQ